MEFIVVSDNHGNRKVLEQIKDKYPGALAFIHCGDSEMSARELAPYYAVCGNNDYGSDFPDETVVNVGPLKVYVTHGHLLSYRNRVEDLAHLAKEKHCQVACTGHTHVFMDKMVDGIHIINPGSLFYNRDGSKTSYAVVEILDSGKLNVTHAYAEDL